MPTFTSRLGLRSPLTSEPPNIPGDLLTPLTSLDSIAVVFTQGTAAARPATPSTGAGTWYMATDTGATSYYDGSAWRPINPACLAHVSYGPTSSAFYTLTTTLTALDTTNLTIGPVVFPPSGKLFVKCTGFYALNTASTANSQVGLVVQFKNHSGGALVGPSPTVALITNGTTGSGIVAMNGRFVFEGTITGPAGSSIQLDLGAAIYGSGSSGEIAADQTSNNYGPIEMFIYPA